MAEPSTIFGPGPAFDVSRRIALLLPIAAGAALQGEPAMASGADEVPITFVARLRARPGEADALRAVLSERQPLHHGCLYFSTAQDTKDRDVFWTSEGVALRLIDNAHPEPRALCAAAAGLAFARRSGDLYPGVCAPAPEGYADWLAAMLGAATTLGVVQVMDARFAVVQDPPDQLLPIQRIPHFDDADPAIHAVVHYLCNPPHRGTAFYRHRATGFERIAASRLPAWRQALAANSRMSGLPSSEYPAGSGAVFEQIGAAPLAFNRMAIYPANCLHAGDIGDSWCSRDRRLTITALVRCRDVPAAAAQSAMTGL